VSIGTPSQPIAGAGSYLLRAKIDGSEVLPGSSVVVAAQAYITLQSKQLNLLASQVLTIEVKGQAGDTNTDVVVVLTDVTPAQITDLFGGGTVPVDHDYGGANTLKVVDPDGAGIQDVSIAAYLTSDYTGGQRGASYVRGRTTTNVQGQWRAPISLDPGSYTLVLSKPSNFETRTHALTVT
jgi:hypothetical protein